jgi:S1-C subfamily serine protease
MSLLDLAVVAAVAFFAVAGSRRGLAAQAVSLAGVAVGLVVGAWIAPHFLSEGRSDWIPLASVLGGVIGAFLLGIVAGHAASAARLALFGNPVLRAADRAGGALAGGLVALAFAWAFAVVFLQQPAFGLRATVQRSALMPALVDAVPPDAVLRTLEGIDPFPILPELVPGDLPEPDPSVLRSSGARAAGASVLKVEGTSCGLGVQGSGWVVRTGVVATNAHVVSGQRDTRVLVPGGGRLDATIVYLSTGDDVALLRVTGLRARPLPLDRSKDFPRKVVLLGYPEDGALTAVPATAGAPRRLIVPHADERGVGVRRVVPIRGPVRRGESGGPVVDPAGRVLAMIFGGARSGSSGFAVPVDLVLRGLDGPLHRVDPGPCIR